MQPTPVSSHDQQGPQRDQTLVPKLQDLTRRLDMSASSAVAEVRRELKLLISEGRIAPPDPLSLRREQLSTSDILRRIAQEERSGSLGELAKDTSPRKLAKKVADAQRSQEEWGIDSMTTPELSNFVSEQIRFHASLAGRPGKK